VWLLPDAVALEPSRVLEALAGRPRVALNCVPSLWRSMLDEIDAGRAPAPPGLRRLLLGGEAVDPALLARTLTRWPDLEVRNLYGPTEATATTTVGVLTTDANTGV
jgi:non-ribosomal peptide synthetase component F